MVNKDFHVLSHNVNHIDKSSYIVMNTDNLVVCALAQETIIQEVI